MFDFISPFWSWFIIIPTLGGIAWMFWLNIWLGHDLKQESPEDVKTMGHVWDESLQEYNNPLPRWWLNMFYITLVFGLIYLALYPGLGSFKGLLNWTQAGQYNTEMDAAESRYGPLYEQYKNKPIAELVKIPDALKMGERLYLNYCTVCHGSDAKGNIGYPNLRDNDWLYGGTPEKIKETLNLGRQAAGMMAWKDVLGGDEEVKNVAQYVLSLGGREHSADAAVKGKAKFDTICMACHGMDGKGNQMLGAPNLTDDIWLYGASVGAIEESIAKGRAGVMPAHGEFLGASKVHLLSAYIYSLSNPAP